MGLQSRREAELFTKSKRGGVGLGGGGRLKCPTAKRRKEATELGKHTTFKTWVFVGNYAGEENETTKGTSGGGA